jgi:hypothetical protein
MWPRRTIGVVTLMGLTAVFQWSCGSTPRDMNFGTDAGAGFEVPPGTGGNMTTTGSGGDTGTGTGGDTGSGGASNLGGGSGSNTDGAADEVGSLLPFGPGPRLAASTRRANSARLQKDSFHG